MTLPPHAAFSRTCNHLRPQEYVKHWNETVERYNASHRMTGAKTVKNLHVLPFVVELLQHVANLNSLVMESLMINAHRGRTSGGPGTRGYETSGIWQQLHVYSYCMSH